MSLIEGLGESGVVVCKCGVTLKEFPQRRVVVCRQAIEPPGGHALVEDFGEGEDNRKIGHPARVQAGGVETSKFRSAPPNPITRGSTAEDEDEAKGYESPPCGSIRNTPAHRGSALSSSSAWAAASRATGTR